jgi:hypothetical protein
LAFNSIDVGATDAFHATEGNYWDTLTTDVRTFVNPGDQRFATRISSTSDCLVWVVNALVVQGYAK